MIKDDCIFCTLTNKITPDTTMYDDDDFRAILDNAPAAKGHILIIPKRHVENLLTIEPDMAAKALGIASKLANALVKTLGCDGVNMLQNTGEAAGQTVMHLHIHLIPRYENDGIVIPWEKLTYAEGEAEELAQRIKSKIAE